MPIRNWLNRLFTGSARTAQGSSENRDLEDDYEHIDPFNPFPDPVEIEIADVFDLHTIAPRDVGRVIEEYLLEARRRRFNSVRLIHGKGIGVQREMVRAILARTSFVKEFTDAPPTAGGWGATIAHLSFEDE
jgi:Smr domain-containing protein